MIKVHLKGTFAPPTTPPPTGANARRPGETTTPGSSTPRRCRGSTATPARRTTARPRPASPPSRSSPPLELGRYGVTVNAIAPGALTRMTEGLGGFASPSEEQRDAIVAAVDRPDRDLAGQRGSSADVTGRVFEASGDVLGRRRGLAPRAHRGSGRRPDGRRAGRSRALGRRPAQRRNGRTRPHRLATAGDDVVSATTEEGTDADQPRGGGSESEPGERAWDSKDCLLYALGVGAGVEELAFTTENTKDVPQQVLPTMAVVLAAPRSARGPPGRLRPRHARARGAGVTLHQALPVEGRRVRSPASAPSGTRARARWSSRNGGCRRGQRGAALLPRSSVFIRGEGGWGGERGPSAPRDLIPDREPDHEVTYATSRDQALLYRLSGDRNPLHNDPSFAARGGFDRPILHGLCTYGFTGRALLHSLCGSDPARFASMDARFTAPVFPGDQLTVRMWSTGDQQAVFETRRDGGQVVIDAGRFQFR